MLQFNTLKIAVNISVTMNDSAQTGCKTDWAVFLEAQSLETQRNKPKNHVII